MFSYLHIQDYFIWRQLFLGISSVQITVPRSKKCNKAPVLISVLYLVKMLCIMKCFNARLFLWCLRKWIGKMELEVGEEDLFDISLYHFYISAFLFQFVQLNINFRIVLLIISSSPSNKLLYTGCPRKLWPRHSLQMTYPLEEYYYMY